MTLGGVAILIGSGVVHGQQDTPTAETGAPSAPSTQPNSSPVPAPRGTDLTIVASGDVLAHPQLWDQARRDGVGTMDFFPMLAHVAPTISSADVAICHLETPIAPAGGPYQGFPKFTVPPQIVTALKRAGYDACSTASNHALDHGEAGVIRTLAALDSTGIRHTGTYRSRQESARPTIYQIKGVKIGHLSYSLHFNGNKAPAGREWLANQIEVGAIRRAAARARSAGAAIVLLSLHWGTENQHAPDAQQLAWAKELATLDDVDMILGHHAHVVQPLERVGGTWVAYGMGNHIARHAEPVAASREGAMVRATFRRDAQGRWRPRTVEAIPTWVDLNPEIRLLDLGRVLAQPDLVESRRAIYQGAFDRIRKHLLSRGAGRAGLVVSGTPAKVEQTTG